jgi:hypothetical protein
MAGTQAGLADGQGALEKVAGGGQVALVGQDVGEVVEAVGGVGMLGTKASLAHS